MIKPIGFLTKPAGFSGIPFLECTFRNAFEPPKAFPRNTFLKSRSTVMKTGHPEESAFQDVSKDRPGLDL
jgi:hypothetical protein